MPSYSVRCIFRWQSRPDQKRMYLYEERITLWLAGSIDEAIALAEEEAEIYASDGEEYLGYCQAYAMSDDIDESGVEVFSLLRQSDLDAKQYVGAFFFTGQEHEGSD
jgi:hypothetical protein